MIPQMFCPCCECAGKRCMMWHPGHSHRDYIFATFAPELKIEPQAFLITPQVFEVTQQLLDEDRALLTWCDFYNEAWFREVPSPDAHLGAVAG